MVFEGEPGPEAVPAGDEAQTCLSFWLTPSSLFFDVAAAQEGPGSTPSCQKAKPAPLFLSTVLCSILHGVDYLAFLGKGVFSTLPHPVESQVGSRVRLRTTLSK